jgi:hypothetical protein
LENLTAIFVNGPSTVDGARAAIDYLSTLDEDDHVPKAAWMMRHSPVRAGHFRIVGISISRRGNSAAFVFACHTRP